MRGKGKLTEADIKMMREVRLALLEADVNFKVVKFIKTVSERALGSDVMQSLTPGQQVIKIVQDELTKLMGGENSSINMSNKPPTVVMMVGLQGAGKTTTAGKLALLMRKNTTKTYVGCSRYLSSSSDKSITNSKGNKLIFLYTVKGIK